MRGLRRPAITRPGRRKAELEKMAKGARHFEANITWTGNRGQGTSAYTAYGRDYVVRAAGKPDLPMSADQAFLGDPARHNPEDLLVVAISSCHMLWYLHLCANAGIIVRAYENCPSGRLTESQEGGEISSPSYCGQR